jgi:hypothetical protein
VLILGLLCFFCIPLLCAGQTFSLSGQGGTIWVGTNGAAGYWRSSIDLTIGKQLYYGFDFSQVISNLPIIRGSLFTASGRVGFDTNRVGLDISGGIFRQSRLDFVGEEPYNDGGIGAFFGLSSPVHLGRVTITPLLRHGEGKWQNGSFYWFFGKPDIPAFWVWGLSAAYDEQHALTFRYLSLNMDILSNDEEPLFASTLDCFTAYYRFRTGRLFKNLSFEGSLGWLYARGSVEGALTASNQHYWLFPYNFYRATGNLGAHAGFGAIDVRYKHAIFQYHLTLGAAHLFLGEAAATVHYKNKKLFGGGETVEAMTPINLGGLGAAFILLDFGLSDLRLGRHTTRTLSLGLKKAFVIPWGYDTLLNRQSPQSGNGQGEQGSSGSSGFQAEWLRTILLSGLSLYCTLSL